MNAVNEVRSKFLMVADDIVFRQFHPDLGFDVSVDYDIKLVGAEVTLSYEGKVINLPKHLHMELTKNAIKFHNREMGRRVVADMCA